jgi:hypothetical protein
MVKITSKSQKWSKYAQNGQNYIKITSKLHQKASKKPQKSLKTGQNRSKSAPYDPPFVLIQPLKAGHAVHVDRGLGDPRHVRAERAVDAREVREGGEQPGASGGGTGGSGWVGVVAMDAGDHGGSNGTG